MPEECDEDREDGEEEEDPNLLGAHGPARMSDGTGMFAWNRSQDSSSRSERRPKPLAAASSPGKRSAMATGSREVER